ncbi:MAG TPA: N-acetylmuramoyl-L-alanine amidase [Bacilli bacterium]|nr:N-acetylmuramoyl-L-alanine amidase [Bacilli bacterium]
MPLVVLDPGHGGRDPGTVGNGYQEKDLVLATSLLIRDALQRCGIRVIMTRQTDTLPLPSGTIGQDLTYRANLANEADADLFLAWHVDYSTNPDVNGVAAWIYPQARGTRTETWAQLIVNAIAQATGQQNRGVYLGDFAVLRETVMDAVLIESGFITNVQEADHLAVPEFQRRAAEAVARAICKIFNLPYVAPVVPQPTTPPPKPTPTPTPTPLPAPSTDELWPVWAAESIRTVIEWGVMLGYTDGTWRPDKPVTRAELAVVLTRYFDFLQSRFQSDGNGGETQ